MNMNKGIIIFGHPRSGTTLLRRLLNSHSAIASPPETHLFSACARFLEKDHTAEGIDMGVLSGLHFAGFENDVVLDELRRFAFHFLNQFAAKQGKKRWAEKTAFDIFKLNAIVELCGDRVFYLGIIRHPLDVAVSSKEFCDAAGVYPVEMHKYIQRYSQPIEAFVHSWIDTTNYLIELGRRQPENCLICRYEDLVSEPEETLAEILLTIGEEVEPEMVRLALTDPGVLGFSDHKNYQTNQIHKNSINKWQSLPRPQLSKLAPLINPLLELCGYDLIEFDEPYSVEDHRRRYINSLMIHANKNKGK